MKTDIVFENLKVGQKLYSLQWGEVEVIDLFKDNSNFPIYIKGIDAEGDDFTELFSKDGKRSRYHNHPSLFLTNPFEKLNQERIIEVMVVNGKWKQKVCIKVVDGWAICWDFAETIEKAKKSTSTTAWRTWRELQPEEPAAEQPKSIIIDGVEYVLTPKKS